MMKQCMGCKATDVIFNFQLHTIGFAKLDCVSSDGWHSLLGHLNGPDSEKDVSLNRSMALPFNLSTETD